MRHTIGILVGLAILSIVTASPARALRCNVGPFIVFFDADNAYLSKEARGILDNVTNTASTCGYGRTLMAGHTDTKEEASLAGKRLDVVRAYLSAHGIPNEDITGTAFGARQPRVPTGPDVSERQN